MTTTNKRPKYKVGRRLGPGVYEKCQTDKFMLAQARKEKSSRRGAKRRRNVSEYNTQLMEKQKVRFAYGIGERQFRNYVRSAIAARGVDTTQRLYETVELRLDNAVYRAGLAPTRAAARQLVSHGHIVVNGKRVAVPSHGTAKGDRIIVRTQSQAKNVFELRREDIAAHVPPAWITYDPKTYTATIVGMPVYDQTVAGYDLGAVLEFYSR